MTTRATARQLEVLRHISAYWAAHGDSPSVRELADTLQINVNGVQNHIDALRLRGLLDEGKTAQRKGLYPAGLREKIRGLFP